MSWVPAAAGIVGDIVDLAVMQPWEKREMWQTQYSWEKERMHDWRRDDKETDYLRKIKIQQETYKLQKMQLEIQMKLRSLGASEYAAAARGKQAGYEIPYPSRFMSQGEIEALSMSENAPIFPETYPFEDREPEFPAVIPDAMLDPDFQKFVAPEPVPIVPEWDYQSPAILDPYSVYTPVSELPSTYEPVHTIGGIQ